MLFRSGWSPYGKPSTDAIAAAEQDLGVDLPDDYRSLLSSCRGGTIRGAHAVVELWAIDELALLTEERGDAIPEAIFFASDGGDRLYFFDPTGRLGRGRVLPRASVAGVIPARGVPHQRDLRRAVLVHGDHVAQGLLLKQGFQRG